MNIRKATKDVLSICIIGLLLSILSACGGNSEGVATSTPLFVPTATSEPPSNTATLPPVNTSTKVPEPTETSVLPTATIEPDRGSALSYAEIFSKSKSSSSSEFKAYVTNLKSQRVKDWQGWIDVVRKQITTGKWEMKIDLDDAPTNSSSWDVRIILPETQAKKYEEGQGVIFSGDITDISCGSTDCDVDLENPALNLLPPSEVAQATSTTVSTSVALAETPVPVATDTISAPTTAPAPPLSIEEQIKELAEETMQKSGDCTKTQVDLREISETKRWEIEAYCTIEDGFDLGGTAKRVAFNVHKALWSSDLPVGALTTWIFAPGETIDRYSLPLVNARAGYTLMHTESFEGTGPTNWANFLRQNRNVTESIEDTVWYNERGR